jgi:hypothetical protein
MTRQPQDESSSVWQASRAYAKKKEQAAAGNASFATPFVTIVEGTNAYSG